MSSQVLAVASSHLVRELGGAHDLHNVKGSPADIIAQHLKL